MEKQPNNPQEQAEDLKAKYPHAFTAAYLQEWARSKKEVVDFTAYIPGNTENRGEVTIVQQQGRLMIRWGQFDNNYSILPDGGLNQPIYLDGMTIQFLEIPPSMAINAKEEIIPEEDSLELRVVKAHRAYTEYGTSSKEKYDPIERERLWLEWKTLRAQLFPSEEPDFLRSQARTAVQKTVPSAVPAPEKSGISFTDGPLTPDDDVADTA